MFTTGLSRLYICYFVGWKETSETQIQRFHELKSKVLLTVYVEIFAR